MVKLNYDVTETEEFAAYAGPTPKRGVYEATVAEAEFKESSGGLQMWELILHIDTKKSDQKQFNGCPLWNYSVIGDLSEEYQKRNLKNILKAFGKKESGTLDTTAFTKTLKGKRVRVLVKNEERDGDIVAKANGLLPFKADDAPEAGSDDAEPEAVEGEEPEGEEPEGEEPEPEADEEPEADAEPETTVEEDLAELDRAGLKQYIKDNAETIPDMLNDKGVPKVFKGDSDDDIRAKIIAAWPDAEEEPEGDGSEPPF